MLPLNAYRVTLDDGLGRQLQCVCYAHEEPSHSTERQCAPTAREETTPPWMGCPGVFPVTLEPFPILGRLCASFASLDSSRSGNRAPAPCVNMGVMLVILGLRHV